MKNPYYNPDSLELELLSFEDCNLSYAFDICCFWATQTGQVYFATDSGCSCPKPFEYYEGETKSEVVQKLERVESLDHGISLLSTWNSKWRGGKKLADEPTTELANWFCNNFKQ